MPTSPSCEASLPARTWRVYVERHGDGRSERLQFGGAGQQTVTALAPNPAEFTNGIALTRFIDWAVTDNSHQPGDYSMLVLWYAYQFAIRPHPDPGRHRRARLCGTGGCLGRVPGKETSGLERAKRAAARHRGVRCVLDRDARDGASARALREVSDRIADRHPATGVALSTDPPAAGRSEETA